MRARGGGGVPSVVRLRHRPGTVPGARGLVTRPAAQTTSPRPCGPPRARLRADRRLRASSLRDAPAASPMRMTGMVVAGSAEAEGMARRGRSARGGAGEHAASVRSDRTPQPAGTGLSSVQRGESRAARPVEARAGVRLAAAGRRDLAVADDPPRRDLRVLAHQVAAEARERGVLARGEVAVGVPDQLDPDREVVAPLAPAPAARPGVVGGPLGRDELRDAPRAVDQEVRRELLPLDLAVGGVPGGVERPEEERRDVLRAEIPGGQVM